MYQSKTTVAKFLSEQIDMSQKSEIEIAEAIGFTDPNIITMFMQGQTKVPLTHVEALANILEIDSAHFMRMVMVEYMPNTWQVVEKAMGRMLLSADEERLVIESREMRIDDGLKSEAERLSVRFLIEHPAQGWRRLSAKRAMSVQRGSEPIIELANLTVRAAEAYIVIKNRKAVCLDRLRIGTCRFDGLGRVDQGVVLKQISEKLDFIIDPTTVVPESLVADEDIKDVMLCLGLPQCESISL